MLTPKQAYAECARKWPRADPGTLQIVASDPLWALTFARDVIKGPFPEGEAALASQADTALQYAQIVLHGPFPRGEPILAIDAKYAFDYAHTVLHGAFFAGEAAIAQNPYYAYCYALKVLRGPFPLGEPILARCPSYALTYACDVLRGRFPACEPHILKDPGIACSYAVNILRMSFPQAENSIYAYGPSGQKYLSFLHTWRAQGYEIDPFMYLAFDLRWGEDCASRMDAHAKRTGLSMTWIELAKTLISTEMSLEEVVQLCQGAKIQQLNVDDQVLDIF